MALKNIITAESAEWWFLGRGRDPSTFRSTKSGRDRTTQQSPTRAVLGAQIGVACGCKSGNAKRRIDFKILARNLGKWLGFAWFWG